MSLEHASARALVARESPRTRVLGPSKWLFFLCWLLLVSSASAQVTNNQTGISENETLPTEVFSYGFGAWYGLGWMDVSQSPTEPQPNLDMISDFRLYPQLSFHSFGVASLLDFSAEYSRGNDAKSHYSERAIQLLATRKLRFGRSPIHLTPLLGYGWYHDEFVAGDTTIGPGEFNVDENGIVLGAEIGTTIQGPAQIWTRYTHAFYDQADRRLMIELRFSAYGNSDGEMTYEGDTGLTRVYVSAAFSPRWHGSDRAEYLLSLGLGFLAIKPAGN